MKSALFFIATVLAGGISFAGNNVQTFVCKTDKVIEKGHTTVISFKVKDIGEKDMEMQDGKSEDGPFVTQPSASILDLNENWTADLDKNGNFHATSDGDGFQSTEFVLYKNRAFKAGYVRVTSDKDGEGNTGFSEVTCQVK